MALFRHSTSTFVAPPVLMMILPNYLTFAQMRSYGRSGKRVG
jgi:hypothetical protein